MTEAEQKWIADRAEHTLRLDYPLTKNSLVFDIGGHTGKFTMDLLDRGYDPWVHIFEPIPGFYWICQERFSYNPKVTIHCHALLNRDDRACIKIDGEASALSPGPGLRVPVVDIATLMKRFGTVDLASINVEGSEYAILERAIQTGCITQFRYLQIQFHENWTEAHLRRENIRLELAKTHEQRFNYPFVWESWKRK